MNTSDPHRGFPLGSVPEEPIQAFGIDFHYESFNVLFGPIYVFTPILSVFRVFRESFVEPGEYVQSLRRNSVRLPALPGSAD